MSCDSHYFCDATNDRAVPARPNRMCRTDHAWARRFAFLLGLLINSLSGKTAYLEMTIFFMLALILLGLAAWLWNRTQWNSD